MREHTDRPAEESTAASDDDLTPPTRDEVQTRDDTSYSPGSEQEVVQAQHDQAVPDDIDASAVRSKPGAGGPDDAGDVDIEGVELHVPGREPADD